MQNSNNSTLIKASSLQQQYWLNQRMHPATGAYNIAYVWSLQGNINIEALQASFQQIIKDFEVFRTTYKFENNILYQEITNSVDFSIAFIDAISSNFPFALNNNTIQPIAEFMEKPFDLAIDLPMRVMLVKVDANKFYLSISIHHIATDLYTWNELFASLNEYYKHFTNGQAIPEKGIVNYKHYVEAYDAFSSSADYDKKLEFWKSYLTDVPNLNEFPVDYKRPKVFSNKGNRCFFELTEEATLQLKQVCDNEYIILYSYLLSTYALMLHKYSRQKKFAIGVPFTNRKDNKFANTTGCFVNILPIVIDLENDITFKKLCASIQKGLIQISRNQEIPYLQIIKQLNLQLDPQFNPVFQYGFTYEPIIEIKLEGIDVHTHSIAPTKEGAKLEQFMHIREVDNKIQGYIEFCSSIFNHTTIIRVTDNFTWVLSNVATILDMPVSKIEITCPAERKFLIDDCNNTFAEYESSKSIVQVFEQQVLRTPLATAIISDKGEISYAQFNENVNKLANYLVKQGINKEEKIGVFIERSPEMVTAIYAILKAGGAYIPLDISNPWDRLEYIIDDSEIKILITNSNLSAKLNSHNLKVIEIDSLWAEIDKESAQNPTVEVGPNSLAYLIYTSGSTGKPKRVMIEHHSVINFINWRQKMYPLGANDVSLLKTPITFDISVLELFWPLFYGGKLGVLAAGSEKYPDQIIQTVFNFKVTFMQFVPSMLNVFLEFVNEQSIGKLASLKYVTTIGEALSPETVNKFNRGIHKAHKTRLINTYGPTETTVEVSYFECTSDTDIELVPIGKPMDNCGFYVVDEQFNIQPIGVAGELLISGHGMARGYYKRNELTAERFIADPFSTKLGNTVYKTGDLARYLPDGNVEFLGRMDFQVKIRGYRIELGEIEVLMHKHPDVTDSVVIVADYLGGEKAILGYVVPREGVVYDVVVEQINALLRQNLPDYMVPTAITALAQFPKLSNGKIDRKLLPIPVIQTSAALTVSLPTSTIESQVLDIWKEVLMLSSIGIHDNFFNIGGNSLLLIQVATKVQKAFNVEVEVVRLFEYPTISTFAAFLGSSQSAETAEVDKPDDRAARMKAGLNQQRDRRNRPQ